MRITFIVSTGRCGSTMLSRILHRHPDVLSLSEFFGSVWMNPDDLPAGNPTGKQFWGQISAPQPFLDSMIREGFAIPEFCYPYGSGQFGPVTGIPRISHMTLPLLTSDPDVLLGMLAAEVPTWPARPAADQFRALFATLARRLGRRFVVERTAGSLLAVHLLRQMFPDAGFVHLHRDGPDCALSLSRHLGARVMGLAEQAGLLGTGSPEPASQCQPDPELAELLVPPLDVTKIMTYPAPPLPVYGRLWSRMVIHGLGVLRQLPPGSLIAVRYEDLVRDPGQQLTRLAEFIGARPLPGWLAAASQTVDAGRAGQAAALADGDLAALRAACEPGRRAIKEATAPPVAAGA